MRTINVNRISANNKYLKSSNSEFMKDRMQSLLNGHSEKRTTLIRQIVVFETD